MPDPWGGRLGRRPTSRKGDPGGFRLAPISSKSTSPNREQGRLRRTRQLNYDRNIMEEPLDGE
jgi:hypothetical protein